MNNAALQLEPLMPPNQEVMQGYANEMGAELKRTVETEIERVIQAQTTPEAFVVGAQIAAPNPDNGEVMTAEARVTVQPTAVAVLGNQVNFIPIVIPPTVQVEVRPPPANLGEAIAQAADVYAGQPIRTDTIKQLEHDIAQAIMAGGPPAETVAPPTPPANEMVYNLGQAHNLYQYNATNIQVTQNNMPITVNLGGAAGGAGTITYRWVQPHDTQQAVLYAQTDLGNVGWNNNYTVTGTAGAAYGTYGNIDVNLNQYVTWTGGVDYAYGAAGGTTGTTWYNVDTNGNYSVSYGAPSKKDQLRNKIRAQLNAASRKRYALPAQVKVTAAELKARDTLRDMISEAEWRRYITNSFIMVKGVSGKWYQIFANHNHERIRVYEKNVHIANLCIHSDGECPPTDHTIAMKIQIELDEESIWKEANTHNVMALGTPPNPHLQVDNVNPEGVAVLGEMLNNVMNNQIHATMGIPADALQGGILTGTALYATMAV